RLRLPLPRGPIERGMRPVGGHCQRAEPGDHPPIREPADYALVKSRHRGFPDVLRNPCYDVLCSAAGSGDTRVIIWFAGLASQRGSPVYPGSRCWLPAGDVGALGGVAVAGCPVSAAVDDASDREDTQVVIVVGGVAGHRGAGGAHVDAVIA